LFLSLLPPTIDEHSGLIKLLSRIIIGIEKALDIAEWNAETLFASEELNEGISRTFKRGGVLEFWAIRPPARTEYQGNRRLGLGSNVKWHLV
jgi:hypothetical protein